TDALLGANPPGRVRSLESLIDSEHGALAARLRDANKEVVYLGFSPTQSDLVLRVGFVNFMANVVEWAGHGRPASSHEVARHAVLPSTETLADPPASVAGTVRGSFGRRLSEGGAWWRPLAWLAAALLLLESLV